MNIFRLQNEVQHYAWGSQTAIPGMLGVANDNAEPWAELWMGAHPKAPSRVTIADETLDLDAAIAADPQGWLGDAVASEFGGEMPFLLKLLAAETPLSIQVHPDVEQARAGFAREEALRVPRSDAQREYPDPYPKPELVVALEPFTALKGFREPAVIAANFREFEIDGPVLELAALTTDNSGEGLRRFVESWLTLAGEPRTLALEQLHKSAAERQDELGEAVRQLLRLYPGDVGVFGPLILNLVHLSRGEGLFLDAREPHAYLSGFAIELCAASDNVLRGGLTPKHVDVPELLRVLDFAARQPQKLAPQAGEDGLSVYPSPTRFFRLAHAKVDSDLHRTHRAGIEIVLCTIGNITLSVADRDPVTLTSGQSALVPGSTSDYRIAGPGEVFVASVPPV